MCITLKTHAHTQFENLRGFRLPAHMCRHMREHSKSKERCSYSPPLHRASTRSFQDTKGAERGGKQGWEISGIFFAIGQLRRKGGKVRRKHEKL